MTVLVTCKCMLGVLTIGQGRPSRAWRERLWQVLAWGPQGVEDVPQRAQHPGILCRPGQILHEATMSIPPAMQTPCTSWNPQIT